jgi:hypothetical protein
MIDHLCDYWFDYDMFDCIFDLPWFTIFIYIAIIITFIVAFQAEYNDIFCSDGKAEYGNGAAYAAGKIYDDDDFDTILQKIRISSRYDEASVYWRRSIIFTILVLFVVLILALQRLPNAYEIIVSFTVIYLFTFLMLNYYQHVISKYATRQISKGTKLLKLRFNN